MARKKKNTLDDLKNLDTSKLFSGDKSYMSLVYGVVTVIVIFVIIFLGVRAISQRGEVEVTEEATQTEEQQRTYTVEEGDNLWGIAEEVYNDGYQWTVIAEANNLESPDDIETGMELTIPELTQTEVAMEEESDAMEEMSEEEHEMMMEEDSEEEAMEEPTEAPASPTTVPATGGKGGAAAAGSTYTVVEGDYLWKIAEQVYSDGYRWVDIARANNISNPDLIYPGDQFTLPQ